MGMRGRIARPEVRLHLDQPDDAPAVRRVVDECLAEEIACDLERRPRVERAREARSEARQRMVAPSWCRSRPSMRFIVFSTSASDKVRSGLRSTRRMAKLFFPSPAWGPR